MALHGLLSWAAFFFLVSVIQPHQANCSSRGGTFGLTTSMTAPPTVGLCESSVILQGYKCQEFEVETQDGYVLGIQRIPEGRAGSDGKTKQPVLLQHGVLVDGMTWLLNSPDQSLAYILADNGYDVWIANTRGTRFSRRHVTLDPTQPAYWRWSWDELVAYDLPATVDFVYRQTGQRLHYVGHSLGTLVALASFSEGKLVDKVRSAALLSPVAYLSHMKTALGVVAAKSFVGEITTILGLAEFNPKGKRVAKLLKSLCSNPGVDCDNLMASLTGNNCCLNSSTVDLFWMNEPQPTSTKNLVHLAQTVRNGIVAKYDYEQPILNMKSYGQAKPPIYDFSNIPRNLPLFMSYGGEDALSDPQDVGTLLDSLKFHDGDKLTVQFVKDYAHADFIMGVSAKEIVYNAVIAFFTRH